MREVIFIKSLCQDIVLFLYKTVNFKTTTECLGKNSRKIPLWYVCTYLQSHQQQHQIQKKPGSFEKGLVTGSLFFKVLNLIFCVKKFAILFCHRCLSQRQRIMTKQNRKFFYTEYQVKYFEKQIPCHQPHFKVTIQDRLKSQLSKVNF